MSSDPIELPPKTAPFAAKLQAAMDRSPSYSTQRALGKALGTDGSLIGKWLKGAAPSRRHLLALPRLLETPADYFDGEARNDLLAGLADTVADLLSVQQTILADLQDARTRIERLETGRARRQGGSRRQGGRP